LLLFACLAFGQSTVALVDLPSSLYSTSNIDIPSSNSTASFKLHGGLILVEGSIDGKPGNYILDTGASDLVINRPAQHSHAHAVGLGGTIDAEEIRISKFKVGAFEVNEVSAFQTNLSTFEKSDSISIAGLIGHSLINEKALHINYQEQAFRLEDSPKKKDMLADGWQVFSLAEFGHILAVKMKIDGETYWMGLDTGAEVNIVSDQFSDELTHNRNNCQQISGLGSESISLPQITTPVASVGDLSFQTNQSFISPFGHVQDQVGKGLDGLLGFPFFQQFEVVLDYGSNRLYLR